MSHKRKRADEITVDLCTIAHVATRKAWTRADQFRDSRKDLYLWEFIRGLSFPDDLAVFAETCDALFWVVMSHLAGKSEEEDDDVIADCCLALHIIQTAIYETCVRGWAHLSHHVFYDESDDDVSSLQWSAQMSAWACASSIEVFIGEHCAQWVCSREREGLTAAYLKDYQRDNLFQYLENMPAVNTDDCWTRVACVCPQEIGIYVLGAQSSVFDYTQIECTLAIEALARGWRSVFDVKYAPQLWVYIDALQARCFVLWMITNHARSVANGRHPQEAKPATSGYEVTSGWVVRMAMVLLHVRRVQINALCTLADITQTVDHADCAEFVDERCLSQEVAPFLLLVRGFYCWIRERASKQTEPVTCEILISRVVKNVCFRFGGKEQHMRLHHNDRPVQAYGRLNTVNSISQAEWMMVSVGSLRVCDFWDRLRVPFVFAEFMTLELFDAFVLQRSKQAWKKNVVLTEKGLLRRGGTEKWQWAVKRHPYIVQVFGGFAVVAGQHYLCTQFAAHALVAWIMLTMSTSDGQFDVMDEESITGRRSLDFSDELRQLIAMFTAYGEA